MKKVLSVILSVMMIVSMIPVWTIAVFAEDDYSGSACTHENAVIINEQKATCSSCGYTGDLYCPDCDTVLEEGTDTEVDPNNHTGSFDLDGESVVTASCVNEGYTGDYCCSDCGEIVIRGKSTGFDTENHKYGDDGVCEWCHESMYADADYSAVEAAIAEANTLVPDNYTNFYTVTDEIANVVYGLKEDEQSKVDAYALAIEEAIERLEPKQADYSRINELKAEVSDIDKDMYTQTSLNILYEKIDAVVNFKSILEQDVVDGYAKDIEDALNGLKYKVNLSMLEAAVNDAENINQGDYSADVLEQIQNYISAAYDLYIGNDLAADDYQGDVDALKDNIIDALNQKLADADYSAVDEAIENMPDDWSPYTDESIEALITAYKNVVRGLKSDKQNEVDLMAKNIQDAIDGLQLKHVHVYDQMVEDDKFLAARATYLTGTVYYKSCTCGETDKSETFEADDKLTLTDCFWDEIVETDAQIGRQGKLENGWPSVDIGRTIIPLTAAQLKEIGGSLTVLFANGSGDDCNNEYSIKVESVYTYFYDVTNGVEKQITAESLGYAAFIIIDNDGQGGTVNGRGYFRIYNGDAIEDNFMFDALYGPIKFVD